MKRWVITLFSSMLLLPTVADGTGPTDRAELEGFVDGAMRALMQSHRVPGGTISVVKDGEILFAKGYGYADVERRIPVDAETTMFRIASISKLFTWTALMQLVERGEVDLEKDVNAYLDFEIPPTFPQPITAKHLLTHTAGFEDRYRGLFTDGIEDLAPLGQILADNLPARVVPPGREAAYSNYGAALAGYIVERASGMPFARYVEEKIYAPLDMAHSTFREPVPAELEAHLATGYAYRNGAFEAQEFEYDPGIADGAMSSSAVDMARFMIAHLQDGRYGGQRILREQTARQMRRRIFTHDPRVAGMAYGFYEMDLNGQRGVGHGGDLLYHHSDLLLLPEHDFGVFVSFNSDSGTTARDEILAVLLDRYDPVAPETPTGSPPGFQARASRYAGHYRSNRRPYETLEKAAFLPFGDVTVRVAEPGVLLVDFMGETARLVEIEPLLFRVASGGTSLRSDRVAFREDPSGDITRAFPEPTSTLHKLAWYETVTFHFALLGSCLVIFAAASVSAIRRLLVARPGAPRARWRLWLIVALSAVNIAFLVGFGVMLFDSLDSALIPDSVSYLLVLPVAAALLTLGFVFLLAWSWIEREGSGRERIFGSVFGLAAIAYLWFLDYWNLLGWHY
jgi:CubicO group peptidase (beta-lactamase class C family)